MCTTEQYEALAARLEGLEGEVAHLKTEVATLRSWTDGWPAEREQAAISALMRTEIDLYRQTAELALTKLADRIHAEMTALQGGMTEGAQEAIRTLTEEVRGFAASVDTSVDWATRLTLLRGILEKQEVFHEKMQQLITANERWWSEERQEREAKAASEAREKRRRMERARRRMERKRRRDKWVGGIVTPMLMMVVGGSYSVLLNRTAGMSPSGIILVLAAILVVAGGLSFYWLVIRTPSPDEQDIDERSADKTAVPPPAEEPGPPDDIQTAGS